MKAYELTKDQQAFIERLRQPFAIFQFLDKSVVTLVVSDGFCELFVPYLEDAGLIYKLDLYVLDKVLEQIKAKKSAGLRIVPHSINLSRSDFDACDMVEEIRRRVDDAGISRDRISVEITESIVGSDFEYMKSQVERFQALGFPVWMDIIRNTENNMIYSAPFAGYSTTEFGTID